MTEGDEMFTIIIPGVIGMVIVSWFVWRDNGTSLALVGGLFGAFIGAFAGFILTMLLSIPSGPPRVVHQEIVALKDSTATEGSFFLGCGRVEEEMYYYYMAEAEGGSYKLEKVEAEGNCYIYEDNTGTPYVELTYNHTLLAPWWTFEYT